MSRPDLYPDDLDGLMAAHESREQARAAIERHRYPAGKPTSGAMPVLGVLLMLVVGLFLINVPALARFIVAIGPDAIAFVVNLVQQVTK